MFVVQTAVSKGSICYKNSFNWLLLTGVSVKADSSMETFAVFEDVQCEQNLRALSLLLNPVKGSFQIEPETDLLQGCARSWVTVELRHLIKG